jgi:hypothetical protein
VVFRTTSDDGMRLWVNGKLLVDDWNYHGTESREGSISLSANQPVSIKLEYFEGSGDAVARLSWALPGQGFVIIPANRLNPPQPSDPPEAISGTVEAYPSNGAIDLSWNPADRATDYEVFRGPAFGGPWTKIGVTTLPRFRQEGLTNGERFWYTVRGRNGTKPGPRTDAVPLTPTSWGPYHLGISVSSPSYDFRMYTNMLYSDGRLFNPDNWNTPPRDADGYPTTDFNIFFVDGGWIQTNLRMYGLNGTYRVRFFGQAVLDQSQTWGGFITNHTYDPVTNLSSAHFVVTEAAPTMRIAFRQTKRTAASPVGSGVTSLRVFRPTTIGGSTPYANSSLFTREFVEAHSRGRILRSMDFVATNGNIQRTWADRRRTAEFTYTDGSDQGYWWQGKGSPWEHFFTLCNITDKDCWINVPMLADDTYVKNLAKLAKARLNPHLRVYVEYSNEVWNFSFPQWPQAQSLVNAELDSNPQSSLNFDGAGINAQGERDYGILVPRYWARRVMQISDIFRGEFGDQEMMVRVRPLFETQAAWQHWMWAGITFLDRYYGNKGGNYVSRPREINRYIWGAGGSTYLHGYPDAVKNDPNATVDSIIAGYAQAWPENAATMKRDVNWTRAFGLARVGYEGGPGLDDFAGIDSAIQKAQRDPRMEGIYRRQVDEYYQAGGEIFTQFMGIGASHGLLPLDAVVGNQTRPKQIAFDALDAAAERPGPTYGFQIPTVIPAGAYHVREDGWSTGSGGTANFPAGYGWTGYVVRAPAAGQYRIRVWPSAGQAASRVAVYVNGVRLGLSQLFPGEWSGAFFVNLPAGQHGIRLERERGTFTLRDIEVKLQ